MAVVVMALITIPIIYIVTFLWKLLCHVVPILKWIGIIAVLVGCPVFASAVMKYGAPTEPGFETTFTFIGAMVIYLIVWLVLWLLTSPLHMLFGMFKMAKEKPKFEEPVTT